MVVRGRGPRYIDGGSDIRGLGIGGGKEKDRWLVVVVGRTEDW